MLRRRLAVVALSLLVTALPMALTGCGDDAGVTGESDATNPGVDTTTADTSVTDTADDTTPPEVDTFELPPESDILSLVRVEPGRGLASGLEQVELIGTGFVPGMLVFFGESLAQDIFVLDNRRIVVLTPPRSPGLVDVLVADPETGASALLEAGYLYFNPVVITEIDPPDGHVLGGDAVTIRGTGFVEGSTVIFGGRSAISVEVIDDTTIQAITPAGSDVGAVNVHVSTSQGIASLDNGFLYVDAPRVTSIDPAVGPVAGGNMLEITGVGFDEEMTVVVGGKPLEGLTLVDPGRVTGTVPAADSAETVAVRVSTSYGTTTVAGGYTYLDDLTPGSVVEILAVSPNAGPAAGGNQVRIVAKGLTNTFDTSVSFGGVAADVLTVSPMGHVAVVEAPASAQGSVDITLSNGNGSDTATAAYTFEDFVRVYSVSPNFGPAAGGTAITVTGEGFDAGASLRVGALPASSVEVVDDTTITAVTPPGSPGLANITVLQGGISDTLYGGFQYQSEMDLWVVDPALGSQAGGTLIAVIGSGFPQDARIQVGGRNATHVNVVSPTLIEAKTPPGVLGTFEVTVLSDSRGNVELSDAFTYYNPESSYGGTWGQEVSGDVNVTVLDGSNGQPLADAFVMLWTDPNTPYQGFTNLSGQITFSGDELEGEQMVTANKEGYSAGSVVEYNATNVTIYLTPTSPPSPGQPPSVEPPFYQGTVRNLGKSVPIPWGTCASNPDAPGTLCDPCVSDVQCGASPMRCSEIPNQGDFCTQRCVNNTECPDGFMCHPLNGLDEHQCVPSAGEITAFCDFSNGSIFGQDLLPDPGIEVNPDFSFELPIPLGEFAVYCWGGIINRITGQFQPYALGVDRHVFANPGDIITGEIPLAHALTRTYTVQLDDVPRGPVGPDINVLFRWIDLGSDGVIEFLGQVDSFGSQPFTLENFLPSLNGDLYDASFTFMAGSFALTADFLPYTMTLHQDLRDLNNDTMFYLEEGDWYPRSTGVTNNINDMWYAGPGDTVGVGTEGLVIRSVGTSWATQPSDVSVTLNGVHGNGTTTIAVGDDGNITHYDGLLWTSVPTPSVSDLRDVWVSDSGKAWTVGFYTALAYDAGAWTTIGGNTVKNLNAVYGFADDDVWAGGTFGQLIHWDGVEWLTIPTGTTQTIRDIWGSGSDNVYFVGEGGTILHWNGVEIVPIELDIPFTLTAIRGRGANKILIAGSRGVVVRFDGTDWDVDNLGSSNNFLAVGGDLDSPILSGGHELILGPMLAVPEDVTPAAGGVMADDYTISWSQQPGPDPHFSFVEVAIPGLFGPIPEWTIVNDWDVDTIELPDLPSIEGTPGITPGGKILTIFRVFKEGFDIDSYSNQDFNQFRWRSWSVHQSTFTKQ